MYKLQKGATMVQRYWLFKSEPSAYSYEELERDIIAEWDGVRNYTARNYLRSEINIGDGILFYYSNTQPQRIVGTATVVKSGYPDFTAWDSNSDHYDAKATEENPLWYMVDIKPLTRFRKAITLQEIKEIPDLHDMVLLNNSRLSVQPVTKIEWDIITALGH